jgi:hypothetical protein
MERLTWNEAVDPMTENHWRVDETEISEHISPDGQIYFGGKAIDKLAEYEDTGLTVEEIQYTKEALETEILYSEYWKARALEAFKMIQTLKEKNEKMSGLYPREDVEPVKGP